jgi:hypothetical protein
MHTRAERIRAEAGRGVKRVIERRRRKRRCRVAAITVTSVGMAAFVFTTPAVAETVAGHHLYSPIAQYYAAHSAYDADHPDPPHQPEGEATYWTATVVAGTARTFIATGPVPSETWVGLYRHGSFGPNIFGD